MRVLITSAVVALLIMGGWFLWEQVLVSRYPAREALPRNGSAGPITEESSVFPLPITVSLSGLNSKITALLPPHVTGNVHTDWPIVRESNLDYDVMPSGLILTELANGRVGFTCNIPTHAVANYRFIIGGWQHNDVTVTASVNGDLLPTVQPDWSVSPNLNAHVDVSQAVIHVGGPIGDIGVTDKVRSAVNNNLPQVLSQITVKLNEALNLRQRLTGIWDDAAQSHQVMKGPDVFVTLLPQSISFVQIKCEPGGTLSAAVLLKASVHTFIGTTSSAVTSSPLPPLNVVPNLESAFSLYLPVTVPLDEIEEIANQQLNGKDLSVAGAFHVSVKNVHLGASGDKVLVQATVRALRTWFLNRVEADITVEGTPTLSADGSHLSFQGFTYTAETKSRLVALADWLLKAVLLDELAKHLNVDIRPQLEKAKTDANGKLAQLTQNKTFVPKIKVEKIEAAKCVLSGDQVIGLLKATGTSQMTISF